MAVWERFAKWCQHSALSQKSELDNVNVTRVSQIIVHIDDPTIAQPNRPFCWVREDETETNAFTIQLSTLTYLPLHSPPQGTPSTIR